MSAPIEVLAIRKLDGKSTVKAFVDIKIGGVTLKGCKVVQQEGQKAWLAMPSIKAERAWQNVVELSKPLRERATEVALSAWDTHRPAAPGNPAVHRNERRHRPDAHAEELARRFDGRGPDEEPPW